MGPMTRRWLFGAGPVLVVGAVFAAVVLAELPYVNGPEYWRWGWRTIEPGRVLLCFAAPLALYAYAFWRWAARSSLDARGAAAIVALLSVCSLSFQLAGAYAEGQPWQRVKTIVETSYITSYYTDALKIRKVRRFLDGFGALTVDDLEYHSATHPPGPILYYYAVRRAFGAKRAALIGGVAIGVLASLGVALIYRFARLWTEDRHARIGPCFLYACLPGLIVFFPEFDQVYPLISMGLLMLWARSLRTPRAALGLGLVLFIATLSAYNLLTLGAPMLLYALYHWRRERFQAEQLRRSLLAAAIALAVLFALHLGLYLWTSYDALDSLLSALRAQATFDQRRIDEGLVRPYHTSLFFDVYDFLLAGGMLTLPLALGALLCRAGGEAQRHLTALALLSILVVDATGLLRCETARVWLFLQPLIVVPAGLQLARLPNVERALVVGLYALIALVLKAKLEFLTV